MRARAVSFKFQQREWLLENLHDKTDVIAASSRNGCSLCIVEIGFDFSLLHGSRKIIYEKQKLDGEDSLICLICSSMDYSIFQNFIIYSVSIGYMSYKIPRISKEIIYKVINKIIWFVRFRYKEMVEDLRVLRRKEDKIKILLLFS